MPGSAFNCSKVAEFISTRSSAGIAAAKELKVLAAALGCQTARLVPQKATTIATTIRIKCFFIDSPLQIFTALMALLIFFRRAIARLLRIGFGHVLSLLGLAVPSRS